MNRKSIRDNLSKSLIPQSFPELAVVKKVYTGSGKGKYCIDVEIVDPGSLEKTGELMSEVPINQIWAGKSKIGIFCPPPKDALVIVNFLRGDRNFPFVDGIYGNTYESADFKADQFLITDGDKISITIAEKEVKVVNDKVESVITATTMKSKINNVKIEADGDADTALIENGAGCKIDMGKTSVKINDVEIEK